MARPQRIEFPGALYHVTSRGNARQTIFIDEHDRESFLSILERVTTRFAWRIHTYCLMGNHYHLLVETPEPNLARGMQQLGSSYAQTFNRHHHRVGHVLQGRYTAILVQRDSHLLELARYIVLNPVRAGICTHPEQWKWSSYRASVGRVPTPRWLTTSWLLGQFGPKRSQARQRYSDYVTDTATPPRLAPLHPPIAGSNQFIRRHLPPPEPVREITHRQQDPLAHRLRTLLRAQHEAALLTAYYDHGYRQQEIADALGVHRSTISRRLRTAEANAQRTI